MYNKKLPLIAAALAVTALLLGVFASATMSPGIAGDSSPGIAGDGSLGGAVEGAIDGAEGIIGGAIDRFRSSVGNDDTDGADSGLDADPGITPEDGADTDSDASGGDPLHPGDSADSDPSAGTDSSSDSNSNSGSDSSSNDSGPTEYAGLGFWGIVIAIAVIAAVVLMIFAFIPKR